MRLSMSTDIHTDMPTLRSMLGELLDVESGLSDKEIDFLDSLNNWQGDFTQRQVDWLQKIYWRVLGK
jgi:hypothetical protein